MIVLVLYGLYDYMIISESSIYSRPNNNRPFIKKQQRCKVDSSSIQYKNVIHDCLLSLT